MYYKTIIRFAFRDIQINQGRGRGYQPKPMAEAGRPYRDRDYFATIHRSGGGWLF